MTRVRAGLTVAVAAALVAGVGVTPSWASEEYFAAQALFDRTVAEARAAAALETVATEDIPDEPAPVAEEVLSPENPVTIEAEELGAAVEFSGFEVAEELTVEVTPLPSSAAASAASELAAEVLAEPFEVTATTASGADVSSFPAEPTFEDPSAVQPIVIDVDPGVALDIDVPDLGGLDPGSVRIVTREQADDPWVEIPSYYDAATGTVKGEIDHLSQFAVIGTPFVPPPGPRIVLDPDDDVGWTAGPNGPATELPLNVALANQVAAALTTMCLADVMVTRTVAAPAFLSADLRAGMAASHNPQVTVTLAFNALFGYEWTGPGGGSQVYSRGGSADNDVAWQLATTLPGYTGRPAEQRPRTWAPHAEFDGLPGAMVHLETLFLDHSDDRAVIDTGFSYIVAGVATSLGMYAENALGADCTDPATGGWPSKPSSATLAQWKQLGYHYHQTYMGDPVSMSTGNLVEDEPLFTLTGPGAQELDLRLVYNSQDGRESRVGTGWSFGLGARAQRFDDGSVLVVRGDGASVVFEADGVGGYTSDPDVHETLSEAGLGQLKLSSPSGEIWVFDAADIEGIGELVSYRDALGTGYDLTYGAPDGDDRFVPLTGITDAAGQTISVTQNSAGQIGAFTHPDGRVWSLEYGPSGDLVSITGPDGRARTFTYDAEHRMLTAIDAAGVTYLVNEFDSSGRVTRQWDANGNLRTFEYTGTILTGGSTVYTNNEGHVTTYEWDEFSRVTSITDALGGVVSFEYDEADNTTARVDQAGNRTEYEYDERGNVTREIRADGSVRSYTYTPLGIVASITDQGGPGGTPRTTTFDVTPTGLTTAVHLPDGSTVSFTYTPQGDVAAVTDQLGNTTSFGYDQVGNLITVTDPLGQVSTSTYDSAGRVVTSTDPTGATTTFGWDSSDRLVTSTDALGARTTYAYNATDQLVAVTDPLGATTEFEWDAMFHLTAVIGPDGARTTYEYDAEDNLVATTDPLGARTVYERDALGRTVETVDALGQSWKSAYDALGQLVAATDPLGAVAGYQYDPLGRLTAVNDEAGYTTTSVYDAVGRLAAVTDPAGNTTRYTYTLTDQVASIVDQEGKTQTYRYDAVGNEIGHTDRRGQTWASSLDALGRLLTQTDPLGAVTSYAYDPASRTVTRMDPLGASTITSLDPVGRPIAVTDPLGAVTTAAYDAAGRVSSVTDANGSRTSSRYDVAGRIVESTNALGASTAYEYDLLGQLTATTNPLGVTTSYGYDALGRLVTVVQGEKPVPSTVAGSDVNVETNYAYTPLGQLASITDAVGAVTRFEYDSRGLPVAETNPLGITSRTEYDALGRPVRATDGNGGTTTTTYTPRSDVASVAYPDGTRVGFEYDADQNPIVMTDSLGVTGWIYDRAGRVIRQTDPNGAVIDYTYDKAGRTATTSVSNGGTVGYTYDAAGRITAQTSPWGSLAYVYDKVGNILEQTRSTGVVTTFAYDALSQVTQVRHHTPVVAPERTSTASWVDTPTDPLAQALSECPAGSGASSDTDASVVSSYLDERTLPGTGLAGCQKTAVYAAGRDFPDREEVFTAGEAITFDYAYDPVGNVTAELETIGSQSVTSTSYAYDDLNRLTQSWASDGTVNTYRYDPVGNRTAWVAAKAPDTGEPLIVDSAYNKAGQLTSQYRARPYDGATSVGFSYDRNGNRVTEQTSGPDGSSATSYSYTSTGRVQSVTEDDVSTSYAYDGLGRQLRAAEKSWAGTSSTRQVWDGLTVIQQSWNAAGTVTLLRDAVGQVALQSRAAGDRTVTPAWLLQDRQGSTVATTSSAGRVTGLVDYSDFGVPVTGSTGLAAATGYTGEVTDVRSGVNSYFSRSYDTFTGTWLTPDLWRGSIAEPSTLHRYGFVGNNPATDRDLYGFVGSRTVVDGGGDIVRGSGTRKPPPPADDPPCVGRGCRPAAADSDTTDRHPPVCGARTLLPGCVSREPTQQQRDNAQAAWAILAGIGVALALGACVVATAGICAGVAAGIAGAGILGAMAAGGAVGGISSAVTYALSPGEKTAQGWATNVGIGIGFGAITGGIGPAVAGVLRAGQAGIPAATSAIRYGPINPGPLPENVASTFRSGSYSGIVRSQPTTLYRVSGGDAPSLGPYWTATPPAGPLQSQLDSALNPAWGNAATEVTTIRVPPGVTMYSGFAAPQPLQGGGAVMGGGSQVYIPKVDPDWIVNR